MSAQIKNARKKQATAQQINEVLDMPDLGERDQKSKAMAAAKLLDQFKISNEDDRNKLREKLRVLLSPQRGLPGAPLSGATLDHLSVGCPVVRPVSRGPRVVELNIGGEITWANAPGAIDYGGGAEWKVFSGPRKPPAPQVKGR